MRYSIEISDKLCSIEIPEEMNIAELELSKEMLNKAIDTRIKALEEIQGRNLPITADIDRMYPPLTMRTRNVLKRSGKNTIADVLDCTYSDLMKMRNMGKKSLDEIKERFAQYGTFREGDKE